MTWQAIGDEIGISRALAWRVGHGLCDSVIARHYFGLPPKAVEVMPCRVCGGVHQLKRCNQNRNPRKRWSTDVPNDFDETEERYFRDRMRDYRDHLVEQIRQP
jgi:hypothetical protein